MTSTGSTAPFDSLSFLDEPEIQFLSDKTGIQDLAELDEHLTRIRAEAYAVFPYTCVRCFEFVKHKIASLPAYPEALRLGLQRPGALFLELGCGCASDTRKIVADGWPINQVIASDLQPEFFEIGHKAFKTTPETFPAKFIAGDVTNLSFLPSGSVSTQVVSGEPPSLDGLTSLAPLQGRLTAIYAYSFFHLFSESQHRQIAAGLASLLSAEPGSMIFGAQFGWHELDERLEVRANGMEVRLLCYSPESWTELWTTAFGPGKVRVEARLVPMDYMEQAMTNAKGLRYWYLLWSVTRI